MGMIAVVPAKANSTRVPNKNYRPFFRGMSLVDLLLSKLAAILPGDRIYLSCEDETKADVAALWGVRFVSRSRWLTENDTPLPAVIRGITEPLGDPDDDVFWCEAIDPLFSGHEQMIVEWDSQVSFEHDSYTAVYPVKHYLLDANFQPHGFGFGMWHVPSQKLAVWYRLNFVAAILTRKAIAECGYVTGRKPAWFEATNQFIDIDTEEDFELAAEMMKRNLSRMKR
jgi:N-acylneuraminate cytidylyltransferase